jgi:hypothetical protein
MSISVPAVLQMEALGGTVGAHAPLRVRRHRGAFDADCLDVGFADIPGFAAVVGLEQFISIVAAPWTVVDHQ